jgi:hypothetical protein
LDSIGITGKKRMDIGKRLKEQAPADVIKQTTVALTKLLQVMESSLLVLTREGHWQRKGMPRRVEEDYATLADTSICGHLLLEKGKAQHKITSQYRKKKEPQSRVLQSLFVPMSFTSCTSTLASC